MRHTDPEPSDGAVRSGARTSLITVDAADTLDTSLIWSKLRMQVKIG